MIKGLISELQKLSPEKMTAERTAKIEALLNEIDEDHDGFVPKEFLLKVSISSER